MMTSRGSFLFFLPWEGYTLAGVQSIWGFDSKFTNNIVHYGYIASAKTTSVFGGFLLLYMLNSKGGHHGREDEARPPPRGGGFYFVCVMGIYIYIYIHMYSDVCLLNGKQWV